MNIGTSESNRSCSATSTIWRADSSVQAFPASGRSSTIVAVAPSRSKPTHRSVAIHVSLRSRGPRRPPGGPAPLPWRAAAGWDVSGHSPPVEGDHPVTRASGSDQAGRMHPIGARPRRAGRAGRRFRRNRRPDARRSWPVQPPRRPARRWSACGRIEVLFEADVKVAAELEGEAGDRGGHQIATPHRHRPGQPGALEHVEVGEQGVAGWRQTECHAFPAVARMPHGPPK